jgi:hypothetical protein
MAGAPQTVGRVVRSSGPDRTWKQLGPHAWTKILILTALLGVLFRTEIAEMVHLWLTDPSWSHGLLIPLFSLYFVNQKRREILDLEYARIHCSKVPGRPQAATAPPRQTRSNYSACCSCMLILAFKDSTS